MTANETPYAVPDDIQAGDLDIAPADDPSRTDFAWSATTATGDISVVRSSQSSPVPIQAAN